MTRRREVLQKWKRKGRRRGKRRGGHEMEGPWDAREKKSMSVEASYRGNSHRRDRGASLLFLLLLRTSGGDSSRDVLEEDSPPLHPPLGPRERASGRQRVGTDERSKEREGEKEKGRGRKGRRRERRKGRRAEQKRKARPLAKTFEETLQRSQAQEEAQ